MPMQPMLALIARHGVFDQREDVAAGRLARPRCPRLVPGARVSGTRYA
jgi:hypothetical protein